VAFCISDEPKSELARDLGDRLQSRNAPSGAFGDLKVEHILVRFIPIYMKNKSIIPPATDTAAKS
jgi:hypothetical protein